MSVRAELEKLLEVINGAALLAIEEYEKNGNGVPSLDSVEKHPLDDAFDSLALRKAIRLLEGACGQLCATLAPPAHTVINRSQDYDWACLRVVIQAHVADILATKPGGMHVTELSTIVNIAPEKLGRILRALATKHCFQEVQADTFDNNRVSAILMSTNKVSSLAGVHTYECATAASVLHENIMDPTSAFSFEPDQSVFMSAVKGEGRGKTFFDWLKAHPDRGENFGQAMIGMSNVMGTLAALNAFPWSNYSTVCDIGSGIGAFAIPLLQSYPGIKVTLHDLPETIAQAKEYWAEKYPRAVADMRVEFSPMNFLEQSPAAGQDIYHIRNTIHNWADASVIVILKNVAKAMGPNSRLLIHDYVLQHLNRPESSTRSETLLDIAPAPLLPNFGAGNVRMYNQDITMLLMYNSKERTLQDSVNLAAEAGLALSKAWDLGETCILEYQLTGK
ncbi:S-adenosyl-L-methionine-dependent methyltransferase [Mycena rebaudengoi]|nr:S-adenosyl-L-methionine-dependent methyltransferase [Mycena rebaudengoi]